MIIKIPLSWLSNYCDIPWSIDELVDRLDLTGLEVDAVETLGSNFDGIVVGHVESINQHPNADRLSVCSVDIGTEILQIICGAPNVAVEQKVPVALVGAELPNGLKIKKAKLRGIDSYGMICSEAEIGLSNDHDGIMILNDSIEIGQPLKNIFGDEETILSIDVGTNRPDCLSLVGIAREITALSGDELRMPSVNLDETGPPIETLVTAEIKSSSDCSRFVGRVIIDVQIGESPDWLKRRVEAAGIRSISNVVDITNYIMLEMGQPLHAYDLDELIGSKIIVRRAFEEEKFTTLDGVERVLNNEVLMIADSEQSIGVGGVMGGLKSEISPKTRRIFLEGACFDGLRVRQGTKALQLQTDASRRFERGMDPELQAKSVDRAAALIVETAGGKIATGRIDSRIKPQPDQKIKLRTSRVNSLLGTQISKDEIATVLQSLHFRVATEDGDLIVIIPSFRRDISREVDLIEEVARIYGYDKIVPVCSTHKYDQDHQARGKKKNALDLQGIQKQIRETIVGFGFTEVITHSFVHPNRNQLIKPSKPSLIIDNPLSPELSSMRTSLAASVLNVVRWNANRKVQNIRLFEIGRVFWPKVRDLPEEPVQLCMVATGQRDDPHWRGVPDAFDFFDLKGIVEGLLGRFGLDRIESVPYDIDDPLFAVNQAAELQVAGVRIGCFGAISSRVLETYEIREPVWMCLMDNQVLFERVSEKPIYRSRPKYPPVERDLAIVVPEGVTHQEIVKEIHSCCGDLLEEVQLFDVYQGEQIAADQKSMAYSMRFRSSERTLTDFEVSELQDKVLRKLKNRYRAKLRS